MLTRGLFVSIGFFLAASGAWAGAFTALQGSCASLFLITPAERGAALAGLRPDFRHETHYGIEVELSSKIKDQCRSGSCWIYSTIGRLEQVIEERSGRNIPLSEPYLITQALRVRIEEALEQPGREVIEGGWTPAVEWLVHRFGAIPASAWTPETPFQKKTLNARLYHFINARIARYHVSVAQARSPEARERLKTEARQDLSSLILSFIGSPPTRFEFEGKSYTPTSFAKAFGLVDRRPLTLLSLKPRRLPRSLVEEPDDRPEPGRPSVLSPRTERREDVSARELEERIIDSLMRGEPVPFTFEVAREFYDAKTGVFSIGAFYIPEGFSPIDLAWTRNYELDQSLHSVLIVGAEVDARGRLLRFKIRNSWGEKSGDSGYDHMYRDYFFYFARRAYVREDRRSSVKPEKDADAEEQDHRDGDNG